MNELRILGRIISIVTGVGIYILIWRLVHESWYEYAAELYDDWCWEKALGIFYRIWVYGHIVAIIGGTILWFIWSWMM